MEIDNQETERRVDSGQPKPQATPVWAPFLALLQHMSEEAFIRPDMDVRFATVDRVEEVLPAILAAAAAAPRSELAAEAVSEKF